MNKLLATATALLVIAATGTACNRGGGANTSGSNGSNAAAAAATAPANSAAPAPAATAQAGESETEVRAFLDRIYAPYADEDGKGADYEAVLEPQLAAAIAAEEGGPGADPFIDAQDWTPFRPTYEGIQVKGDRAIATAAFDNGGARTRIEYQLIRTPSGWRAYDVQSANGGSLRERFLRASQ